MSKLPNSHRLSRRREIRPCISSRTGVFHNPTWTVWEEALGVLHGGHAVSFASGMAAVAALFGTLVQPGDVVILPADSYYSTRVLASNWLTKIGVQVRLAPTRGNAQAEILEGARLLWIETPSNPRLDVCDIRRLVQAALSIDHDCCSR